MFSNSGIEVNSPPTRISGSSVGFSTDGFGGFGFLTLGPAHPLNPMNNPKIKKMIQ